MGTPQNGYGQPSATNQVVYFCSGDWWNFTPALTMEKANELKTGMKRPHKHACRHLEVL